MSIRVGTSGWNYPTGAGTWNGVFYPARRPRRFDELRYYAEHFDIVEVNSTFYRMPDPGLVGKWVGVVSEVHAPRHVLGAGWGEGLEPVAG